MVNIQLENNKEVSIRVTYNKETYRNQNKGFCLHVILYDVTQEEGYKTKKCSPLDNCNFKQLLKEANRYNAKIENNYNLFIENNKEKIKELYLNKEYLKIVSLLEEV